MRSGASGARPHPTPWAARAPRPWVPGHLPPTRRRALGAGLCCPAPLQAPGLQRASEAASARRRDNPLFSELREGRARKRTPRVDSGGSGPGGPPPSPRGQTRPRSQQPGALPPLVTDPGRCSSCQNRGCLFHSGSQSPKGEQGALMLVFGHKQLSLIILFLLSLPVPPASSPRNRPRNPPRSADRSGFCAARGSGAFMSLRV